MSTKSAGTAGDPHGLRATSLSGVSLSSAPAALASASATPTADGLFRNLLRTGSSEPPALSLAAGDGQLESGGGGGGGGGEDAPRAGTLNAPTPHRTDPSLTKACCNPLRLFATAIVVCSLIGFLMLAVVSWFFVTTTHCWGELQVDAGHPACRLSYGSRIAVTGVLVGLHVTITCVGQKVYTDGSRSVRVSEPVSVFTVCLVATTLFFLLFPWMPVPVIPMAPLVCGYVYAIKRQDARMRMLVFVVFIPTVTILVILLSVVALRTTGLDAEGHASTDNATVAAATDDVHGDAGDDVVGPFSYDPLSGGFPAAVGALHSAAVAAALIVGWAFALIARCISTYQSGTKICGCCGRKRWREETLTYDELCATHTPETFDVLLDSETRYTASRMTQLFSRSAWTHAAMIVKEPSLEVKRAYGVGDSTTTPDDDGDHHERFYVFEAVRPQVRLTGLRRWMELKSRAGRSGRRVSAFVKLQVSRDVVDAAAVHAWMLDMVGTRFVTDPLRMRDANYQINHNYDGPDRDANDDGSVFCSQLVATGLQHVGLLDPIRPAANYTPSDVSNEETTTRLFLLQGARFSRDRVSLLEGPSCKSSASL